MNDDTPEGRLEAFARAMEINDVSLIPQSYVGSEDPKPMIDDIREVCARSRAVQAPN